MSNMPEIHFRPIIENINCFHKYSKESWDDKTFPYHRHDAYEIFLFVRGETRNDVGHASYHLNPGDMIIINPNELHRVVCNSNKIYERVCVNIRRDVLDALSSDKTNLQECFEANTSGERRIVHFSNEQVNQVIKLMHSLEYYLASKEYGSDLMADSYLSQLLVFINTAYKGSSYTPPNVMSELIRDTMLYIKEHLDEALSIEQLSKHFYLSGTFISREFKKQTGLTLGAYILGEKIAHSKNLLMEGKNVSEACYLSGFCDYANYIRSFTKAVGISPGQYRKVMS